jgi:hypothetical protein
MALLTFGVNKEKMKELRHSFPDKGFHLFLIKKIGINFLKHPLNPLPMFKN